jgi:radical SAM enzyme (TIGR01210 family)
MMASRVKEQIRSGYLESGKSYGYNDDHDPTKPAQLWFQQCDEGLLLFIVFYTQACRWSRCLGCSLPSKCSEKHISFLDIMAQIDYVFTEYPEVLKRRGDIKKIIISNNGSVLDEDTFSSTALMYLMSQVNVHFPNLHVLSLETRPEYVDDAELEFISRALREGDTPTELEITIGMEVFDDEVRNDIFRKGLNLDVLEEFVRRIAERNFSLKVYLMQKPVPGMTDQEAIDDIQDGIDYLAGLATKYNARINVHINPTYVGRGTQLEKFFADGDYEPPQLVDVARAARHAAGKGVSVYIGLSDEGLSVEGGSFIRETEGLIVDDLERFNTTQNFSILDGIISPE